VVAHDDDSRDTVSSRVFRDQQTYPLLVSAFALLHIYLWNTILEMFPSPNPNRRISTAFPTLIIVLAAALISALFFIFSYTRAGVVV
jgi:hypothetical protein